MINLFECPVCHTAYGSFKEVLECVQWHPPFLIANKDLRPAEYDEREDAA